MKLSFIKLDIDIMNDTKIKIIRKMPAGKDILIAWVGILCLAMKSGKPGILEIGDGIPFNDELLSAELDIPLPIMRAALKCFSDLKMIEFFEGGEIYIKNFEKHQELDKIETAREKHRLSQAKYREKQQLLLSRDYHVKKSDAVEGDIDKELEKESDKNKKKSKKEKPPRHKYGEYKNVLLSDQQYDDLIVEYGNNVLNHYIEKMSSWQVKNGKSYKNYKAALKDWIKTDKETPAKPKSRWDF
jgi:predicted phage replisome organizer